MANLVSTQPDKRPRNEVPTDEQGHTPVTYPLTQLPVDPRNGVYERFDQISDFDVDTASNASGDMQAQFSQLQHLPLLSVFEFSAQGSARRYLLREKSVALGRFTFVSTDHAHTLTLGKAQLVIALMRGTARRVDDEGDYMVRHSFRSMKRA